MYKNKIVVIIVLTIISFFIFRHCTVVGVSVVESISSCTLYPLLRVQQLIVGSISSWLEHRVSLQELEKKVEDLKKQYDNVFAENIALKATYHYAEETKELRDFNKRYLLNDGHVAHILARHFSPNNQFFLVDAGTIHGIQKDMVALYVNSIVGRVVSVYPWYCKVCLITDVDCKVAAVCLSLFTKNSSFIKSATGIHEGTNNRGCTVMQYVSHLESVAIGDDVLSSGEGLIFPKGFALGKVLSADKGDLFYTITVQPALDFQSLRYCTLIAKENI